MGSLGRSAGRGSCHQTGGQGRNSALVRRQEQGRAQPWGNQDAGKTLEAGPWMKRGKMGSGVGTWVSTTWRGAWQNEECLRHLSWPLSATTQEGFP